MGDPLNFGTDPKFTLVVCAADMDRALVCIVEFHRFAKSTETNAQLLCPLCISA